MRYIHVVVPLSPPSVSRILHFAKPKSYIHSTPTLHSLLPPALATTFTLSVCVALTSPGASSKCNHMRVVLVCLAYFVHHNVLKVHPCKSKSIFSITPPASMVTHRAQGPWSLKVAP